MPLIEVGSDAPNFTLKDQSGKSHSLKDFHGRSVVLYFYPEDDTPLCTSQACQFRDHHPDFRKVKAAIVGVSPDSPESHRRFVDKHALDFTLLADTRDSSGAPKVSTAYGVWTEKNMYGKMVVGMLRTTYLIGPDGKVARRWDRVKTPGHAASVLEAARMLHTGEKLTILGKPKTIKKKTPGRQKTRTQGGHSEYSGVKQSKGKQSPGKAAASKASTGRSTVRGKR